MGTKFLFLSRKIFNFARANIVQQMNFCSTNVQKLYKKILI